MSKCVNENCKKDPFDDELSMVLANQDADFACCNNCLLEYHKQRDEFFANIGNDDWYNKWMFG